jgi:uncharacterized protein YbjT (DUF2867 family)
MNILILGGTVFLGKHVVEAALLRGHHTRQPAETYSDY